MHRLESNIKRYATEVLEYPHKARRSFSLTLSPQKFSWLEIGRAQEIARFSSHKDHGEPHSGSQAEGVAHQALLVD